MDENETTNTSAFMGRVSRKALRFLHRLTDNDLGIGAIKLGTERVLASTDGFTLHCINMGPEEKAGYSDDLAELDNAIPAGQIANFGDKLPPLSPNIIGLELRDSTKFPQFPDVSYPMPHHQGKKAVAKATFDTDFLLRVLQEQKEGTTTLVFYEPERENVNSPLAIFGSLVDKPLAGRGMTYSLIMPMHYYDGDEPDIWLPGLSEKEASKRAKEATED